MFTERHPEIKILILTTFDDDQYILDALNNGALGHVLKNVKPGELVMSVKAVHCRADRNHAKKIVKERYREP